MYLNYNIPSKVSGKLLKYYPVRDYHLEAFLKDELFFARPTVLNDSFDVSGKLIEPYPRFKTRIGWNSEKASILSEHGICSFIEAKSVDSERMWSFYADNFDGFAIEFDPQPFLSGKYAPAILKKVKYLQAPLNLDDNCLRITISDDSFRIRDLENDLGKYGDRIFHCLHLTKSCSWKEENEWRMIMGNRAINKAFKRNATRTGYSLTIERSIYKKLYIGYRVSKEKQLILRDIAQEKGMNCYMVEPVIRSRKWTIDIQTLP